MPWNGFIRGRLVLTLAVFAIAFASAAHAGARFHSPLLWQLGIGHRVNAPPAWTIAHGDLDRDGSVDIVTPMLDSMGIYIGHGDGTFDVPLRIPLPARTTQPVVADFDGDGALDIGWGGDRRVGILFGDGTGRNWTPMTLSNSDPWCTVVAGDFDADGRVDLCSTSFDGASSRTFRTFLNRSSRTLEPHVCTLPVTQGQMRTFTTGDFNEDGRTDLVIAEWSPLEVWTSNGDGTFARSATVGTSAEGLAVGDFDGDGHADLLAGNYGPTSLVPGLGNGTFGSPRYYLQNSTRSQAIAKGDLNGDGILDFAGSNEDASSCWTQLGLGGGAFTSPRYAPSGTRWGTIALIDVDRDERLDFVALTDCEPVVALGDGAGGFRRMAPRVPVGRVDEYRVTDLDGDGIADVVTVDRVAHALRTALGRPQRTFVAPPPLALTNVDGIVAIGDLDRDGRVDVIAGVGSGMVVFCRGIGDGRFDSTSTFSAQSVAACAVGDVTGDGSPDLVGVITGFLRVLPGNGAGGFGPALDSALSPGVVPRRYVVLADLEGDGRLDAVISASSPSIMRTLLYTCTGDGLGHFAAVELARDDGGFLLGGDVGDVDEDGFPDLVGYRAFPYYASPGPTRWTGTLWSSLHAGGASRTSFGAAFSGVTLQDVDSDGHLDAVSSGPSGPAIAFGDGAGRFGRSEGYGPGYATIADFDGDGRLDLLASHTFVDSLRLDVYYGRESTPPTITLLSPDVGATYGSGSHVPVTWQANDDVAMGTVDVFVSRHGRDGPFTRISTAQPPSGTWVWPVSGTPTDSLAFKVVAHDAADNVASAVSDSLSHVSDVAAVADASRALDFAIHSVRPNPARAEFAVEFALAAESEFTITLHDVSGRAVATLAQAHRPRGLSVIQVRVPAGAIRPGVTFVRLTAGGQSTVARVVYIR